MSFESETFVISVASGGNPPEAIAFRKRLAEQWGQNDQQLLRFRLIVLPTSSCYIPVGWPGLEGDSPKPRGFLRSAQSSPGHPFRRFSASFPSSGLGTHALEAPLRCVIAAE